MKSVISNSFHHQMTVMRKLRVFCQLQLQFIVGVRVRVRNLLLLIHLVKKVNQLNPVRMTMNVEELKQVNKLNPLRLNFKELHALLAEAEAEEEEEEEGEEKEKEEEKEEEQWSTF